jgi:hypothetical protein
MSRKFIVEDKACPTYSPTAKVGELVILVDDNQLFGKIERIYWNVYTGEYEYSVIVENTKDTGYFFYGENENKIDFPDWFWKVITEKELLILKIKD